MPTHRARRSLSDGMRQARRALEAAVATGILQPDVLEMQPLVQVLVRVLVLDGGPRGLACVKLLSTEGVPPLAGQVEAGQDRFLPGLGHMEGVLFDLLSPYLAEATLAGPPSPTWGSPSRGVGRA